MSVSIDYRHAGRIARVLMSDPAAVAVDDFRAPGASQPFVSLSVSDGEVEVAIYLTPVLADELGSLLWHLSSMAPAS